MYSNSAQYNLAGNFIVSTGALDKSLLEKKVILICKHTDKQSIGIMINCPLEHAIINGISLRDLNIQEDKISFGGYNAINKGFIIYEGNSEDDYRINDNLSLSINAKILDTILNNEGPENYILATGCTTWENNTLIEEIINGNWMVYNADIEILFNTKLNKKWNKCIRGIGIKPYMITNGGYA